MDLGFEELVIYVRRAYVSGRFRTEASLSFKPPLPNLFPGCASRLCLLPNSQSRVDPMNLALKSAEGQSCPECFPLRPGTLPQRPHNEEKRVAPNCVRQQSLVGLNLIARRILYCG